MAMKDILGRFKREPEEEYLPEEEFAPEEAPASEKPSFVFTDINSEPIDAASAEPVPEAPARGGPVKVGSSENGRIQMFELDLGGSKVKLPEEPVIEEAPVVEEPVYETYVPVEPKAPEPEDTIVVAPTPDLSGAEEDYEIDFGYSAPGALDDVTYTTDPASVPKPAEPEPIVYSRSEAPAENDDEYYDSYEPMFEESYGPGSYFAGEQAAAAAPIVAETVETPVYDAPEADAPEPVEPVKVYNKSKKTKTYKEDRPRYENYRKDYQKASYSEPRSYENNIDDSVFLPDEGEAPMSSRRNRRRLTVAILAVLAALLLCLGGILISHFVGRSRNAETVTTARVKTTAFERSVSNNASATTTTIVDDESVQYDENGEISSSTATTAASSSTSRRTSTRTTTTRRSTTTTRRSTTTTTRSTTASTTQSTSPATTTPSTAVPSTEPSTRSTTAAPSPWDHVGG